MSVPRGWTREEADEVEALLNATETATRELHAAVVSMIEARIALVHIGSQAVRCQMAEARGIDMAEVREKLKDQNPFAYRDALESATVLAQTIDQQINERGNRIREILLAIERRSVEASTKPAEADAG